MATINFTDPEIHLLMEILESLDFDRLEFSDEETDIVTSISQKIDEAMEE